MDKVKTLRLSDNLIEVFSKLHPNGFSDAVKECMEESIMDIDFWEAKMEYHKGMIEYCKKMMDASPLYSGYKFTKAEQEFLKRNFDNAVKQHDKSILLEKARKGYNSIINKRLTLEKYRQVVKRWMTENELEFEKEGGESGNRG